MARSQSMKVIVGMSGGVDSSVAALLLKQQGYQVEALFMKNWDADDTEQYCNASQDYADAQSVCARLGIPLHRVNFTQAYWEKVFSNFLSEFQAGRTPNPDILCNKEIKFKAFLDYALTHNAHKIAMGHYVRCQDEDGLISLRKGIDSNKDQSYFLYTLNQNQLRKSLFPIGHLSKTKVRQIAAQHNLINHNKKDSTGICFIGERKFKTFLNQYFLDQPGDILTIQGHVIGQHNGLMYYTLGQRQGLNIGGLKEASEAPWYVVDKDLQNNTLVVAQGNDHPLLYSHKLTCSQVSWISGQAPHFPLACQAKSRYRQSDQPCVVKWIDHNHYEVNFLNKQRAITPGQSVVFYQGDRCLGGGIIDNIIR